MAYTVGLDLHLKDAATGSGFCMRSSRRLGRDRAVSVAVLVDGADPAHVVVVKVWEAESDYEAYRQWRTTGRVVFRGAQAYCCPAVPPSDP